MKARQYLYPDIPNFYVLNENSKTWTMRKKNRKPVFSRMYLVNPRDRERFFKITIIKDFRIYHLCDLP